ncbi:uncharacterized protein LOC9662821 isoform X3 [Selaginella moellendorffii]|uniref:uncharacterized protein LOC9662821 isoform X3 n=1 Tax=Selaginella moellendorffii TaxID=88036 RepID=UPI000D1C7AD7|nr:uncharacterized protein LOC9662821 isoform X3 [Selaginella moellendorffii]|eukprot:XP_024516622.1 uncharacterized protein LOC9662821 isoform X3 [Selaginella moellendorffii]
MQTIVWSCSGGLLKTKNEVLETSTNQSMFVFGLGYTGVELGKQLRTKGWKVSGTCRSAEKRRTLEECYGVDAYIFGPGVSLDNGGLEALYQATHLVSCVPPDPDTLTDMVLKMHLEDIEARCRALRWIGYISSTGVYGDHRGGWVDESTQAKPVDRKSKARVAAENSWLELQHSNASVQIFRAGGIYGPGRSVLDTLQGARQRRVSEARHSRRFTSRIHVSDVCQVLMASMESPHSGRIYNVVDDDPAPRSEVAAFGMELLGMELKEESPGNGDGGSAAAEKRVMNKRIKEELGVELMFPSYREGLAAVVRADS